MMTFFKSMAMLTPALFAAAAATPEARADFSANLYTAGHADISVGYDSSTQSLNLFYEISTTAVVNGSTSPTERDIAPSQASVVVGSNVLTSGNSSLPPPYAGSPIYLLGQTSAGAALRPFLGFGAESIDGGVFLNDTLRLSLVSFTSSSGGQFVQYTNGSAGSPAINTADGLSSNDGIDLFALGHDHYNLGFTTAGVYDLTFQATGTLLSGETISTTDTFRFLVNTNANTAATPEPASLAMVGLGLGIVGAGAAWRSRRSGHPTTA